MTTKYSTNDISVVLKNIFMSTASYDNVAAEFHAFHKNDFNVFLHLLTTGLGVWGAVQLAIICEMHILVGLYAVLVLVSTPWVTGIIHSALILGMSLIQVAPVSDVKSCLISVAAGYILQDVAHYVCAEKTYLGSYIFTKPFTLVGHTFWLLPLVLDAVFMRKLFLPWFVTVDRTVVTVVKCKDSVTGLRNWIAKNIAETKETTHVWPHESKETSKYSTDLENDENITAAFRKIFNENNFDLKPVTGMNEIYVTAVGAKREINSDAVFYTPHTDGPYWFLPQASLYRVLVGLTPNQMVKTNFNLQHDSRDKVIDVNDCLGFDYSRELHWINHTDKKNEERRSVLKLHYVVYPKGWHRYGALAAHLNTSYNTWARSNFLYTLRPEGLHQHITAWWIWLTTWFNAMFILHFGWENLVYISFAAALGYKPFLYLTSFRHYITYITTFGIRDRPVAFGQFIRDVKLYKTLALCHLAYIMYPHVDISRDIMGLVGTMIGFGITVIATVKLGFERTYFGMELGFCKPKWIEGFPYGYIPHPMIVGQLIALSVVLVWWNNIIDMKDQIFIFTHMSFYAVHMMQEEFYSSYYSTSKKID